MDNGALGSLHAGYVLPRRYGDIYLCFRGTAGDATWMMQDWDGRGDRLIVQSQAEGWAEDEYRQFDLSVSARPPGTAGRPDWVLSPILSPPAVGRVLLSPTATMRGRLCALSRRRTRRLNEAANSNCKRLLSHADF